MRLQQLAYKPDWPQAQERLAAFWSGEALDRVAMSIVAPRDGLPRVEDVPPGWFVVSDYQAQQVGVDLPCAAPPSWNALWCDPEYVVGLTNAICRATYFGGEAAPRPPRLNIGLVTFGEAEGFTAETVWVKPTLAGRPLEYRFDAANPHWQQALALTRALVCDGQGRYIVPVIDFVAPTDTLLSMRGASELCMDLVDQPEAVRRTLDSLLDAYEHQLEALLGIIDVPRNGSMSPVNIWGPGRTTLLACDMSALIGPRHLEQFVVPEIERMVRMVDHRIYHLDGPAALRHLPRLLGIKELDGIQWWPGAGQPRAMEGLAWLDLCRQVQAAGKRLQILVDYRDVEAALQHLDPRGLFLRCTRAPSVEAAERLLKDAERWSCRHPWDVRGRAGRAERTSGGAARSSGEVTRG